MTAITALAALGSSAATGYALIYTRDSVEAGREQLRLAEQGQTTERFGRAVEQLGHAALDVRVGGIYALERIMRDSPQDQPAIMEVLQAFIRVHSASRGKPPAITDVGAERLLPAAPADIQAALNVIVRRDHSRDGGRTIDLSYTKLFGADLSDAYLVGAELEGADLTGATMFRANLTKAHLLSTNLSFASCRWANFTDAGMVKVVMVNTFAYNANFNGAELQAAIMHNTFLDGTTFVGANIRGAKITDPVRANFAGAEK
ncbi:pentapeptide repeat-containing protein [Kribbella antibiotica]|uniref:pentapeptide repeat-containing protein n=1 Tax=Kribbella antibiotica TaxID=190195 RepID=UPI001EDFDEC3|nr:pentapeptide repeat-containing protein [Kribbella antibiotica]